MLVNLRIKYAGQPPDHHYTHAHDHTPMRYPADPAALRKGSPEWRRYLVDVVGLKEAWLDLAASGANLPFQLADREGRFDDMMKMLHDGKGADEKENHLRDYLLFDMRMTRIWCGPWAIERQGSTHSRRSARRRLTARV